MAHKKEFEDFIAESRKIGLADIKATEAAFSEVANLIPSPEVVMDLIELAKMGQEYVRLEAELSKEADHG